MSNFKKLLATWTIIGLAVTALAADATLVGGMTGKLVQSSCACSAMGSQQMCAQACHCMGACCCNPDSMSQ